MNTRFPGFIEAIIKTIVCNYDEDTEEPHYAGMHNNTKLFNAITDINWIITKRNFIDCHCFSPVFAICEHIN